MVPITPILEGWYVGLLCGIAVQGRVSIQYAVQLLLLVVVLVSIITIFYLNEAYIPARRVYSLYVSLMAIFHSNWQYANSIWS